MATATATATPVMLKNDSVNNLYSELDLQVVLQQLYIQALKIYSVRYAIFMAPDTLVRLVRIFARSK